MVAQPNHVHCGRMEKRVGEKMDGQRDAEVFTLQLFLFELSAKQAEQEAVQILVIPKW